MKCVYVAGKLNDTACQYIQHLRRMVIWADKVKRCGVAVFVPGIDILMGLICGEYEYPDYFDNSQPWLERADAVFLVPGWETSKGTKREVKLAKKLGIPIFDTIPKLRKWAKRK